MQHGHRTRYRGAVAVDGCCGDQHRVIRYRHRRDKAVEGRYLIEHTGRSVSEQVKSHQARSTPASVTSPRCATALTLPPNCPSIRSDTASPDRVPAAAGRGIPIVTAEPGGATTHVA